MSDDRNILEPWFRQQYGITQQLDWQYKARQFLTFSHKKDFLIEIAPYISRKCGYLMT